MKPEAKGFTLIELLVVITIIAILAGLIFPAALKTVQSAARRKAGVQAAKIVHAVKLYQTTYSRWPGQRAQGSDGDIPEDLILNDLTNHVRKIDFLELEEQSVSADTDALVDPWGRDFVIILDEDGDGDLIFTATDQDTGATLTTTVVNQVVGVMSWGRNPGKPKGRIYSWK